MNAPPAQSPEPLLSLPVGIAALGLILLIGSAIVLALWLARRGRRATLPPPAPPGLRDAPWLGSLLDGFPDAVLVTDAKNRAAAWNAAATRLLALDPQAPQLPLALASLLARVLDSGEAETIALAPPHEPDRHLRATAWPLSGPGRPGVLVQVSEPTAEAGSAESYRRLISTLAHELRTPLTAILGHADILQSCDLQADEALWRRSRVFIASEAERLARLVEDLLTLSRLELTPLQRRPVNLRAVAEEAISALFQTAEARGVRLSLHAPPDLPRVAGDRDRLQQVFLNLLDNAVKYSPGGGEAAVRFAPQDGGVLVEVIDQGQGIAPEDLPHIFDPLFRSESVGDTPGTGLGLTVVRAILEQHGARIDVQSAPGRGTTFQFRLPFACSSTSSLT